MLVFHFLPHEHVCPLLPDEANKNKTILVIAKNLRAVYRMVSEKFFWKNWKFYKECIVHWLFCNLDISQFSMPNISLNIACKELKIAPIARQVNQIF